MHAIAHALPRPDEKSRLDRALSIFSEVTIVVAGTGKKNPLFTPEERVELIREVTAGRKNVKVDRWPGLIMEYAGRHEVSREHEPGRDQKRPGGCPPASRGYSSRRFSQEGNHLFSPPL